MVKRTIFKIILSIFLTFYSQKVSGTKSVINQEKTFTEILEVIKSSFEDKDLKIITKNYKNDADKVLGYTNVLTSKGTIKGQLNPYAFSFFSIKYAEAPIGKNRFFMITINDL